MRDETKLNIYLHESGLSELLGNIIHLTSSSGLCGNTTCSLTGDGPVLCKLLIEILSTCYTIKSRHPRK